MIHHLLGSVPWEPSEPRWPTLPARPKGRAYRRPSREVSRSVADHAATLL
jgi:hypothetical protein